MIFRHRMCSIRGKTSGRRGEMKKAKHYSIEYHADAWEAWSEPGWWWPDHGHCVIINANPHAGSAWKKQALIELKKLIAEMGDPEPHADPECECCNED